ncbi:hypothetical protein GOBAR_DD01503 [Gossypium barbadense]|nr:hypothetical protein GOBAR_DD01503 [Gossypium barbadense]
MEGLQAQQKNGGVTESGNDADAGISHNRVGQILHSVVLGTFNVGDEGEGIIPDRTRVIRVILNSFGVGSQPSATNITRQSSTSMNFKSPTFCSTLRQAEHAAVEVALNMLANRGPSKALAARILLNSFVFISTAQDETGVYKNLLQEIAHRAGLNLPVYTTIRSGPGHVPTFSCMVEPCFFHKIEHLKADINSRVCPTKNENRSSAIFNQTRVRKNEPLQYESHFHGTTS